MSDVTKTFTTPSLDSFVDCAAFRNGRYLAEPQSDFVKNMSVELFPFEGLRDEWEGVKRFMNLTELHLHLIHASKSKANPPRFTEFAHRVLSEQISEDIALHAGVSSASCRSSPRAVASGVKPDF